DRHDDRDRRRHAPDPAPSRAARATARLTLGDPRGDDRRVGAPDRARRVLGPGLVLAAAAVVLWVRLLPLSLAVVPEPARDLLRYRGADGREHVYLGDFDSYLWVREARNVLRTGTTCAAVVAGVCRGTYAYAPVGEPMHYHRS